MAGGNDTAADCNGLNLGDFGCLEAGDIGLGAIIALAPTLFGLWMKLLGGKRWRKRIREAKLVSPMKRPDALK